MHRRSNEHLLDIRTLQQCDHVYRIHRAPGYPARSAPIASPTPIPSRKKYPCRPRWRTSR
jgi:hypothetical protein